MGRTETKLELQTLEAGVNEPETERWEVLHVFDYTSERKRMSVLARDPRGIIHLFSKGADSVLIPLMTR